jgi:hypothetical protein
MSEPEAASLIFETPDIDTEERFVREYILPTFEREPPGLDHGWFHRYGQDPTVDGGEVRLVFEGDPDALVDAERGRWETLRAEEVLDGWRMRGYDEAGYDSLLDEQTDAHGEWGGEFMYRVKPMIVEMTAAFLSEFDEIPPAVGTESASNPSQLGYWAAVHYLCNHLGYDWHEEIDLYAKGIRNRVRSLTDYEGIEEAREALDDAIARLESVEEDLDEFGDDPADGA